MTTTKTTRPCCFEAAPAVRLGPVAAAAASTALPPTPFTPPGHVPARPRRPPRLPSTPPADTRRDNRRPDETAHAGRQRRARFSPTLPLPAARQRAGRRDGCPRAADPAPRLTAHRAALTLSKARGWRIIPIHGGSSVLPPQALPSPSPTTSSRPPQPVHPPPLPGPTLQHAHRTRHRPAWGQPAAVKGHHRHKG